MKINRWLEPRQQPGGPTPALLSSPTPEAGQASLRTGFLHLLGGSLFGRGLSFVFNLLLSRSLGPANLGILNLILSATQTVEMTVRGGVDFGITCALTGRGTDLAPERQATIAHSALRVVQTVTVAAALVLWLWVMPGQGLLPSQLPLERGWLVGALLTIAVGEALGTLHWDLLLVQGNTAALALRQGLFAPLKMLAAWLGALVAGLAGALVGYGLVNTLQMGWLWMGARRLLPWPTGWGFDPRIAAQLMRAGAPMYLTNLWASLVFLPLLGSLAQSRGVADVGYLRVGQIVVQLFTLLPGALMPVLFVQLREGEDLAQRQRSSERSLRAIWWSGLACLVAYGLLDRWIVPLIFGQSFLPSLQATRILVLAAVAESISQVLHQPLLASRRTRLYFIAQNGAVTMAALAGWILIPRLGVDGFLVAKLLYALTPLLIYYLAARGHLLERSALDRHLLLTLALIPVCWLGETASAVGETLVLIAMAGILLMEAWAMRGMIKLPRSFGRDHTREL
jgi:O-antigen/teichoic acid export membrane protein